MNRKSLFELVWTIWWQCVTCHGISFFLPTCATYTHAHMHHFLSVCILQTWPKISRQHWAWKCGEVWRKCTPLPGFSHCFFFLVKSWCNLSMSFVISRPETFCLINLSVPDIYEARKHPFFTFWLIFLSSHDVSKIWMISFWSRIHRWEKWSQSGKMPPGGRAEIENVKSAKSHLFNFKSATRWHIWAFTPLFLSMEHCPKRYHSDFWYVEY